MTKRYVFIDRTEVKNVHKKLCWPPAMANQEICVCCRQNECQPFLNWIFGCSPQILLCSSPWLLFLQDCTKVWPPERRGVADLDWGCNWIFHWGGLSEGLKEWCHTMRVSVLILKCFRLWSLQLFVYPHSFLIVLATRLINKLQPGSVKKVNNSTQNWHQVKKKT